MFQGEPPVYRNKNWCRALPLPCSKAFFIFIFIKAVENIANFILSVVKKMSFCSTPNEVCFGGGCDREVGFLRVSLDQCRQRHSRRKAGEGWMFFTSLSNASFEICKVAWRDTADVSAGETWQDMNLSTEGQLN